MEHTNKYDDSCPADPRVMRPAETSADEVAGVIVRGPNGRLRVLLLYYHGNPNFPWPEDEVKKAVEEFKGKDQVVASFHTHPKQHDPTTRDGKAVPGGAGFGPSEGDLSTATYAPNRENLGDYHFVLSDDGVIVIERAKGTRAEAVRLLGTDINGPLVPTTRVANRQRRSLTRRTRIR